MSIVGFRKGTIMFIKVQARARRSQLVPTKVIFDVLSRILERHACHVQVSRLSHRGRSMPSAFQLCIIRANYIGLKLFDFKIARIAASGTFTSANTASVCCPMLGGASDVRAGVRLNLTA